jgi:hypothetical protein
LCYVTANRLHTCGTSCPSPLIDPIIQYYGFSKKLLVPSKLPAGVKRDPKPKMLNFVKPWDSTKAYGQTSDLNDPNGPFIHHDLRFTPVLEEVLVVKDKGNKDRCFRVLTIKPTDDPKYFPDKSFNPAVKLPETLLIGQELEKDPLDPKNKSQEAVIFVEDPRPEKTHHQLQKKSDASKIYYVISYNKMEK